MRLIDDDREGAILHLPHLAQHEGELLQGRDDDLGFVLQGLSQLGRVFIDLDHHARRCLELLDRVLQLLIQHPAIGDHDDAGEDFLVLRVEQGRQAVGRPADRVGFARAGRVLHQVSLANPLAQSGGQQLVHGVQLVVAREQQAGRERLLAGLQIDRLFELDRDELADDVEERLARQHLMPEVGRGVPSLLVRRVTRSGAAKAIGDALVEGKKPGLGAI